MLVKDFAENVYVLEGAFDFFNRFGSRGTFVVIVQRITTRGQSVSWCGGAIGKGSADEFPLRCAM
jgi:hypothetical protein